jgi:hypothetical protein
VATVLHLGLALLAAVLGAALVATAVGYAGAAAYRRRHPPPCALLEDDERGPWPARVLAGLATFAAEWAALAAVVLTTPLAWRQARRRGSAPRGPRAIAVVSLHRPCAAVLARRLRRDGRSDVRAIAVGTLGGDIEQHAACLAEALEGFRATGGGDVDVIAHGVAGLVVRAHVRARGRASGVARLVTLGTPHQGTAALGFARLAPDSAPLTWLASGDPVPALVDCTAIYSADDACIVPAAAGYWPGAFNIEVRGLGHTALLFSRRVYELVCENLEAPRAGRTADAAP